MEGVCVNTSSTPRADAAKISPHLLDSARLIGAGVPHAFTTRRGGVSSAPFDSLNFGNPSDIAPSARDPAANIRHNHGLVLESIGCAGREVVEVHQVHGAAVHVVRAGAPTHPHATTEKADAIVTDDPARVVTVRVADCTPVLLASRDGRIVGAVHAGWRGVISGAAPAAVAAMRALGADEIIGAIGPCIGADHFEVSDDVASEFRRVFGERTPHVRDAREVNPGAAPGKFLVDMKLALREQLAGEGVTEIDVLPHCTVRDATVFFSHRRERGLTGRMIGVIGPRSA